MKQEQRQKLWDYLNGELSCIPLETNLDDIENIINPPEYPQIMDEKVYSKEQVKKIITDIQNEYHEAGKSFDTAKTIWEVCENKISSL